jgi:hypothetical protein
VIGKEVGEALLHVGLARELGLGADARAHR